jgi:hypothetical protein
MGFFLNITSDVATAMLGKIKTKPCEEIGPQVVCIFGKCNRYNNALLILGKWKNTMK